MTARFIAHVERPDGRVHHIDCDAAHENDAGRLALTVNTYIGAVAAYAPGAWASYRLEAPPEPVSEQQLMAGEKSLNDYRRWLGFTDAAKQEHQPEVGDTVHVVATSRGNRYCSLATVHGVNDDDSLLLAEVLAPRVIPVQIRHDESRETPYSWHWPHDDEPAAPEPEVPSPPVVNINVHGSVVAEKQLQELVERLTLRSQFPGMHGHFKK